MAVFRVNKTKDYTTMSNYHFKDKNLSLKAKGLLSQMLSLPKKWDYSIAGLVAINKESKSTIQTILKELEDNGYLVRTRIQNEKGQFDYIYDIYENPYTKKPNTEEPQTEKPCTVSKPQYNTNNKISNNKKLNNNYIYVEQAIEYMNKLAGTSFKSSTEKTKRLINARLNEGFDLDDIKDVIYYLYNEWYKEPVTFKNGRSSKDYYRPNTIFGTNFESYLNEYKQNYD